MSKQEKKYYPRLVQFDYMEKRKINVVAEIGRGGFGIVYKCINMENSKKYALKILYSTAFPELISSELTFLRLLYSKPCMPKLVDSFVHDYKLHILMDYQKSDHFIEFFDSMEIDDIKHYIFSLVKAVHVLHEIGIVHRDVKPGNFLYSKKERKGILIDFGLSEVVKKLH